MSTPGVTLISLILTVAHVEVLLLLGCFRLRDVILAGIGCKLMACRSNNRYPTSMPSTLVHELMLNNKQCQVKDCTFCKIPAPHGPLCGQVLAGPWVVIRGVIRRPATWF